MLKTSKLNQACISWRDNKFKSGWIDQGDTTEGFIIYDNGRIALDNYYSSTAYLHICDFIHSGRNKAVLHVQTLDKGIHTVTMLDYDGVLLLEETYHRVTKTQAKNHFLAHTVLLRALANETHGMYHR